MPETESTKEFVEEKPEASTVRVHKKHRDGSAARATIPPFVG